MMHRFPGDDRKPAIDRQLGDSFLLNSVGPAKKNLPGFHFFEVSRHWLRKNQYIAFFEQLVAFRDIGALFKEIIISKSVVFSVEFLEEHLPAQGFRIAYQVLWIDGDTMLVLLE